MGISKDEEIQKKRRKKVGCLKKGVKKKKDGTGTILAFIFKCKILLVLQN